MSPCVLADWRTSMSLWAATNTVLLAGAIVLVLGLAGLSHRRPIWWGAAGLMLAAAPGHTAISVGQPAVLVTFLIVLAHAIRAARARSSPGVQVRASPVDRGSNRAGILLGLAAALKPQIGVFFVAYEFARGRWRSGIAAGLTIAVVLGVGVWQLHRHSIDWLPAWRSNLDAFALTDNANPALTNPLRYQLINLHVWFGAFVSDTTTLKGLVYAACAALALAYALASRKPRTTAHDLLDLAFVGVISLLVVYHRAYDATILLLGAGLFARELTGVTACLNARAPVALLGLFLLPSLLPGASALVAFARPGGPLEGAAQTAWWNALVVPHLTVALVALAATLIVLRARSEPALTPP
jgi:hypothetical protein